MAGFSFIGTRRTPNPLAEAIRGGMQGFTRGRGMRERKEDRASKRGDKDSDIAKDLINVGMALDDESKKKFFSDPVVKESLKKGGYPEDFSEFNLRKKAGKRAPLAGWQYGVAEERLAGEQKAAKEAETAGRTKGWWSLPFSRRKQAGWEQEAMAKRKQQMIAGRQTEMSRAGAAGSKAGVAGAMRPDPEMYMEREFAEAMMVIAKAAEERGSIPNFSPDNMKRVSDWLREQRGGGIR